MKLGAVPIIDSHVHLYPPEVNRDPVAWAAACGEKHWAEMCTRRRKDGQAVQTFPSVDQLLRDMDAAGVAKAVLLGWYWASHAACVEQNKFYADCVRAHPDRLAAFATVHPAAGAAALGEVRRAQAAGLIGLGELSPHSQQVSLADPTWRQLMALAGELKLPVNLHVSDPKGRPYPARVATPLADFIGLAREFPATKFILAHWGGGLAFDSENRVLRNIHYDTAASPLLYGPDVWTKAPSERVLFGSDYPLVLYPKTEMAPGFGGLLNEARNAGVTDAVLGGNAAGLLGW
ncbi:MAG: TatD family hydrolase [Lacunisphaera sp.]|nr:TatD family hydrolase [Lacunisphaera sp.]